MFFILQVLCFWMQGCSSPELRKALTRRFCFIKNQFFFVVRQFFDEFFAKNICESKWMWLLLQELSVILSVAHFCMKCFKSIQKSTNFTMRFLCHFVIFNGCQIYLRYVSCKENIKIAIVFSLRSSETFGISFLSLLESISLIYFVCKNLNKEIISESYLVWVAATIFFDRFLCEQILKPQFFRTIFC